MTWRELPQGAPKNCTLQAWPRDSIEVRGYITNKKRKRNSEMIFAQTTHVALPLPKLSCLGGVPDVVNRAQFHQNPFRSFGSLQWSPGFSGKNRGVTPSVAAPGVTHLSDATGSLRGRNMPFSHAYRCGLYNRVARSLPVTDLTQT